MTHRLHLFAFLSCLPLVVGRLDADTADNETTRVLLNLQRAALSELLRSSPPKRLFTLALAYDRSSKTFEPLPEAMQKELLNTMGANKKLFVEPSQLNLPSARLRACNEIRQCRKPMQLSASPKSCRRSSTLMPRRKSSCSHRCRMGPRTATRQEARA